MNCSRNKYVYILYITILRSNANIKNTNFTGIVLYKSIFYCVKLNNLFFDHYVTFVLITKLMACSEIVTVIIEFKIMYIFYIKLQRYKYVT